MARCIHLAEEAARFAQIALGDVTRFEAPNICSLNFLLEDSLGGCGSESLKTDAQGKTHGLALLLMEIEVPEELAPLQLDEREILWSVRVLDVEMYRAWRTLDDDPELRPDKHIFVELRAPWFAITDELPQLDKRALIEHRLGLIRATKAFLVPGGLHKGIESIGFAFGWPTTLWTAYFFKRIHFLDRRANTFEFDLLRQHHG